MIGIEKLRIRREILDSDAETFRQINDLHIFLSDFALSEGFVDQILDLLHEGLATGPNQFIKKVFFEFQQSVRKTERNRTRIYQSLSGLGKLKPTDDEMLELVNIYRSVVSELFDPYISLIVAIIQYKEGIFSSYIAANLGFQERNKVDFCLARLRPSQLFAGYNPVVRNAATHPGTDGLKFEEDKITFRNISRSVPPRSESVEWTIEELNHKILQLMDFVHSIQVAVNIFGIDISDMIRNDQDLQATFIADILTINERNEMRNSFDAIIEKIFQSSKTRKEKLDAFTNFFFMACKMRGLDVRSASFREADRIIYIVVENSLTDPRDEEKVLARVKDMLRLAVIAEPCFRPVSEIFWVMEEESAGNQKLSVRTKRDLLRDYGEERAGLVDLLHECEVYLDEEIITIEVDFAQIAAAEQASFERLYPRKSR